jgi:ArsR family transcriptional regulator
MKSKVQARLDARAKVLKALAHPTRLFIVEELAKSEHCVCELTEMIGADTSTVSKHLSVLKSAGIVQDDKRGLMVYYRLANPCVLQLLGETDAILRCIAASHLEAAGVQQP